MPGERVPGRLTPGLAGYHYRLLRAELFCHALLNAPAAHLPVVLAYYVNLPRGLGMVEYPAHPESPSTRDSSGLARFRSRPCFTSGASPVRRRGGQRKDPFE